MTTDCHEPMPAPQDEFWGDQTDWSGEPRRPEHASPRRPSRAGGIVGRFWATLVGSGTQAERAHGSRIRLDDGGTTSDDVAGEPDAIDEHVESSWDVEPEPRPARGPGVDPLLARIGALAVIVTLAVPVVLGFASDSEPDTQVVRTETPATPVDASTSAPSPAVQANETVTELAESAAAPATAASDAAGASAETPTTSMPCGSRYELAAGDYWIRIADAAGVPLADLLGVNGATVDTVLVPERSICLPVGAATPAPPTTVAPDTTQAPAPVAASRTTTAPRSTPSTAPTTVPTSRAPAPTTTVPQRPPAVSTEQAVAIIRSVWPDDLEERALEIAWRESKYQSNVNNWCCYGLFQIHWNAHRSWLGSLGITSASQLYDPTVNATAAYTLYQRAGGFGPWGG